jgi:thiamine biosynthesis lipoprotein
MVGKPMKTTLRAAFLLALWGCILPEPVPLARFEFMESHMGTLCRVVLYAEGPEKAREASAAAFRELAATNDRMSDYKESSELSLLCRMSGQGPQHVTDPLWEVLSASRKYSEMSGGAFDVTVGPLVKLWRRARKEKRLPSAAEIEEAKSRSGYALLALDASRRTAELRKAGMQLDLGAIAKGYGCDRALAAMAAMGIRHAFVDTGGGMALGDPPPGKPGWRIQVGEENSGLLILSRCGVATSGDTEQFVELEGRRYSHIVDPKTGVGLVDSPAVTVVAPDGLSADALATALSVMGREHGLKLAEDLPSTEAQFRWREDGRRRKAQTQYFATLLERD